MNNVSSTLHYLEQLHRHLQGSLDQEKLTAEECNTDEISFFFHNIMPEFTNFSAIHFDLDSSEFEQSFVMDSDQDYRKRINTPYYAKGHGARRCKNPFPKDLSVGPQKLYEMWTGQCRGSAIQQHWPDFGLIVDNKVNVVFEAKYYKHGNPGPTLAKALYEAAFYRGLPTVVSQNPRQCWVAYDYACMIAVDSSPDQALFNAYENIPEKVRESFWLSSSLYPMILSVK